MYLVGAGCDSIQEELNEVPLSSDLEAYLQSVCEDKGFEEFVVHYREPRPSFFTLNIEFITTAEGTITTRDEPVLVEEIASRVFYELDEDRRKEISDVYVSFVETSDRLIFNTGHSDIKPISVYDGKLVLYELTEP